ncbi:hypothetical protein D5073_20570 [Pectobacterium versatile]|uniref:hypothetical protein n=2 Tax=Pectobacteriaceae TaxID=1903410 RepID=UPI000E720B4A|nr:hypothetical protein D5073_20570 [Pectobacterium versatile]RJL54931.1 hypothetical protein D5076_17845 [Pectobacterium versatile]RJL56300.1 hypothetical protein D5080_21715 [Pectobacterium versatile]
MGAFGSLIGVCVSALINYLIAKNNRSKSLNGWRREKLLSITYDFFEQFKTDTTGIYRDFSGYDFDLIQQMVKNGYSESGKKAHQICLFLNKKESSEFLEKLKSLIAIRITEVEKKYTNRMSNNYYDYYHEQESMQEYLDLVDFLSIRTSKMK